MQKAGKPQVAALYPSTIEGRPGRAFIVQHFTEEFVPKTASPRGASLFTADELGVDAVITHRKRTCFVDNTLNWDVEKLQARIDELNLEIVRRVALEPFGSPRFIWHLAQEDEATRTKKIRSMANNQVVTNPQTGEVVKYKGLVCFQVWDLDADKGQSSARTIDYRDATDADLDPLRGEDNNNAIFFPLEWLDAVFTDWAPGEDPEVNVEIMAADEEDAPTVVSVLKEEAQVSSSILDVTEIELPELGG